MDVDVDRDSKALAGAVGKRLDRRADPELIENCGTQLGDQALKVSNAAGMTTCSSVSSNSTPPAFSVR